MLDRTLFIGDYVFENCSIRNIVIPNTLKKICSYGLANNYMENIDLSEVSNLTIRFIMRSNRLH